MEFKLIIKKINNTLNKEEEIVFDNWYNESIDHKKYFEKVKENYQKDFLEIDVNKSWGFIQRKIRPNKSMRNLYWKYAAAASIVLILSLTFFLNKETKELQIPDSAIVNNQIKNGSDKAILTLEDGSEVALVKGKSYNIKNATSNGKEIVYKAIEEDKKEIAYNFLTVPRGGQYQITLADNTKVWLNSESQLKYPVSFISGEPRQVELVYGEGYFDVSPSTDHNGDTFQVINKNQKIEVLGTEFNIKAYKDETNIYTTLVEGKVAVSYNGKNQNLIPNQQSNYDLKANTFKINTVDIYSEIAWKDGIFNFREKELQDVITVLERWYNVNIVFEDEPIKHIRVNGLLRKNQNLENILKTLKITQTINYKLNDNTIILKK